MRGLLEQGKVNPDSVDSTALVGCQEMGVRESCGRFWDEIALILKEWISGAGNRSGGLPGMGM